MDMTVLNTIIKILAQTLQSQTEMSAQTLLLGAIPEFDSMTVVTVVTALENHFGFVIDDDELSADLFESVGTLCAFVEQKLNA